MKRYLWILGLALLVMGCEARVSYDSKPIVSPAPSPDPLRVLREGPGVGTGVYIYCDVARGNLIYAQYKVGMAVVPNGCAVSK